MGLGGTLCRFFAVNCLASSSILILSDPFEITEVSLVESKLPISVLRGVFGVGVGRATFAKIFVSLFKSVHYGSSGKM